MQTDKEMQTYLAELWAEDMLRQWEKQSAFMRLLPPSPALPPVPLCTRLKWKVRRLIGRLADAGRVLFFGATLRGEDE